MTNRRGLGRGLGALIPSGPPAAARAVGGPVDVDAWPASSSTVATHPLAATDGWSQAAGEGSGEVTAVDVDPTTPAADRLGEVAGATYAELPVDGIAPNPRQPREVFDEEAMAELVASIAEVGLLQPVVVRRRGAGGYELVMGERRWRAAKEAGLVVIPAIIRETGDENLLRDALLENLHRAQLNPLEEAAAYAQLLEDFGCTHEELAGRIGRSRPQITNTVRLLKLSPPVQRRVAAGVLSAGHARALVGIEDPTVQANLAHRIVAEGLSVRAVEEIVAVGSEQESRPRRHRSVSQSPLLADVAARLSERFETRVKVDLGRTKGRITVEYATLEDLDRLVRLMDPTGSDDR